MEKNNVGERESSHRIHDDQSKCMSVRFGDLVVHEFLQILGDNPAVSEGPPLTIEWQPMSSTTMNVEFYERVRQPRRRKRSDLKVSRNERGAYLLSIGYNFCEIIEAINEASKIRSEREASLHKQKWDRFSVVVERATSKMKKIIGGSYKQQGQQRQERTKRVNVNAPSA